MDDLDKRIINLLISKIDSGVEKNLDIDVRALKGINYGWTESGKPMIDSGIASKLSPETLKEIYALFPR